MPASLHTSDLWEEDYLTFPVEGPHDGTTKPTRSTQYKYMGTSWSDEAGNRNILPADRAVLLSPGRFQMDYQVMAQATTDAQRAGSDDRFWIDPHRFMLGIRDINVANNIFWRWPVSSSTTLWYTWKFEIPATWELEQNKVVVWQFYESDQTPYPDVTNPPWSFEVVRVSGIYWIRLVHAFNVPLGSSSPTGVQRDNYYITQNIIGTHEFTVKAKWVNSTAGLFEMWYNGGKVLTLTGIWTTNNPAPGIFINWGMYLPGVRSGIYPAGFGANGKRRIIFNSLYIGTQAAGTQPPQIPPVPTGLQATAGDAQAQLAWNDSSGATSYKVYRSLTSGGSATVVASNLPTSDFLDTAVVNGTPYFYKVSAVNVGGESAKSSEVTATPTANLPPAPPAPTGLTATAGNEQIQLGWAATPGAVSYNLYRSATSGGAGTVIATLTTLGFIDTGRTNGTPYYYKVSGVNTGGEGVKSTEATATPVAPTTPPPPPPPQDLIPAFGPDDFFPGLATQSPIITKGVIAVGTSIYARCQTEPDQSVGHMVVLGGRSYFHSGIRLQLENAYRHENKMWPPSPATGRQWTLSEVNNAEAGWFKDTPTSINFVRVSQAVVLVMLIDMEDPVEETVEESGMAPAISLLTQKTHRLSSLWKINRTDRLELRFCDHNAPLVFNEKTYTPVGGFDPSARRKEVGLRESTMEVRGVISSPAITIDDLRAGRYRGAKVTEYLVDWKYPWAGAIQSYTYWISEVRFNGTQFVAELSGIPSRLRPAVGRTVSRLCPYDLGDAGCKVNLMALTSFGCEISNVVLANRIFTAANVQNSTDDWFTSGALVFTTGANHDLVFEVKDHIGTPQQFDLQLATPFPIAVGDKFNVQPGCNKLYQGDCFSKYNNQINFGGFPWLPGNDRVLETPSLLKK